MPHDTVQCLNQTVEYQCTVSGSGFLIGLRWRLLDENQVQIAKTLYSSDEVGPAVQLDSDRFTFEQLSVTPLVSNISFTATSRIDGYTIVWEDANTMNNITILINIPGKN